MQTFFFIARQIWRNTMKNALIDQRSVVHQNSPVSSLYRKLTSRKREKYHTMTLASTSVGPMVIYSWSLTENIESLCFPRQKRDYSRGKNKKRPHEPVPYQTVKKFQLKKLKPKFDWNFKYNIRISILITLNGGISFNCLSIVAWLAVLIFPACFVYKCLEMVHVPLIS